MTVKITKPLMTIFALATLLLAACGNTQASPTPTEMSIEAVYTAAAMTVAVNLTGTAAAQPSATPSPEATATGTATQTPAVTATLTTAPQIFVPTQAIVVATITAGPSPTATFGAVGCNNSTLVSDVTIPDGTKIDPGKSFTKTWRIKNTGTCAWNGDYKFTFTGGELFGSDTTKIRRNVAPNATTDFSLNFTAPTTPGTYTGYWRLYNDKGEAFGAVFSVNIVVPGPTSTVAPTNTTGPTTGPTPTASETSFPTVTNTPEPPTVTPSATP